MMLVERKSTYRCNICQSVGLRWLSPPWIGHSGKRYKRRQIQKKLLPPHQDETDHVSQLLPDSPTVTTTTTRSGRVIRKPARFCQALCPECSALKKGEV